MKSLKSKVIASLAMLVVAAVMMTSSSFAWYTISTKGELDEVQVKMDAVDNFEIALATDKGTTDPGEIAVGDSGDDTTYGQTVAASSDVHTLGALAEVTSAGAIQAANYGDDKRITTVSAATEGDMTDDGYFVCTDGSGEDCAVVYGIWLRSNSASTATLAVSGNNNVDVAVIDVDAGTVTEDGETVTIAPGDEGEYFEVVLYYDGNSKVAEDVAGGFAKDTVTLTFTPES